MMVVQLIRQFADNDPEVAIGSVIGHAVQPPRVGHQFVVESDDGTSYYTQPVAEILPGGMGLFIDDAGVRYQVVLLSVPEGVRRRVGDRDGAGN